jgi:hypothetical protein
VKDTRPSLPLSDYAGKYTDPLYGTVEVSVQGNGLRINMNGIETGTVEHWNFDSFYGPWDKSWYGKFVVQFKLTVFGKVESLMLDGAEFKRN